MLIEDQIRCKESADKQFHFLKNAINICMVDDDHQLLNIYSEILNQHYLYNVISCKNVSETESLLSSKKRIHVCIMDLGLENTNNDEFYLLKKFSPCISFIVLTGKESIKKGFDCGKYGSFSVFEKPVDFDTSDFFNAINNAFIYNLVSSSSKLHKPVIEHIVAAFFLSKPADIFEWAMNANVSEQYLRKMWNMIFGYQPKYFLWLYNTMSSAFSYYNSDFLLKNGAQAEDSIIHLEYDEREISALEKYYQSNKNIFEKILMRISV